MDKRGKELRQRLLSAFKAEAHEHVQALSSGLIALETSADNGEHMPIVETVFREAHSLKGAARAIDHPEIESICQAMESVFAAVKRRELVLSATLFDVLNEAVDRVGRLLPEVDGELEGRRTSAAQLGLLQRLEQATREAKRSTQDSGKAIKVKPAASSTSNRTTAEEQRPAGIASNTVRVATTKLDAVLFQSEELLSAKLSAAQLSSEIRELAAELDLLKKEWIRVAPTKRFLQQAWERESQTDGDVRSDPRWHKFLEFLAWESGFLKTFEAKLGAVVQSAEQGQRALATRVDGLMEDMKQVLTLPVSTALGGFPKLVRDLARDQGKEAELLVRGDELEIDRRILEELRDPLVHLIRNCIDHGIETPQMRISAGKSPRGTLAFTIAPKDGRVEFVVSDDGAGIDVTRVRDTARKLGVVPRNDAGDGNGDDLELVFHSGLSTSPIITDLSGRGLGLAIVREKVERLGGTIAAETQPGRGTSFRMRLPLTLSTFRGVRVRVGDLQFVVPSTHVEQGLSVRRDAIRTVENRETIPWNGRAVSLVHLGSVLELPAGRRRATDEPVQALVLDAAGRQIAFAVDEIVCEQEVLVKPLGGAKAIHVRNIAGATVLGNGQVALILDVPDLLRSAVTVAPPSQSFTQAAEAAIEKKSILVTEDSITSRSLLKDILEAAGYQVDTAVDGVDGITRLKSGRFDLLISDVEMPRMNGFDLTAKVRADKTLSRLPVVLVTALESREHRELGVEVGANAYIVKSSFDQSNLLDVVRRLL